MYRCVTKITINQRPSADWPNRNTVLNLDFANSYESSSSWRDLTNKGKFVIPKNLYFRDQFGKLRPLRGTNVNVGGFSSNAPLLLRGDKVKIESGYKYVDKAGRQVTDTATWFEGYVSKVGSKIPIECELEDNMWSLKQTPMDNVTYSGSTSVETILQAMVNKCNAIFGTAFTVNMTSQTIVGNSINTGGLQAAQVLIELQKKYGFESYFRGNELRSGVLVYLPSDNLKADGTPITPNVFAFQQNIISDELQYQRKDDITLSAKASNCITEETGGTTKDGRAKTRKVRLEVLVTLKHNPGPGEVPYVYRVINKGEVIAQTDEGERREFHFPSAMTTAELASMAYEKLRMYLYTGFKGKFTTFGIPFVQQGDNIVIKDPILPERNGTYRVRSVGYSGGVNGLRQEIELDFKLNVT